MKMPRRTLDQVSDAEWADLKESCISGSTALIVPVLSLASTAFTKRWKSSANEHCTRHVNASHSWGPTRQGAGESDGDHEEEGGSHRQAC